VEKQFFETLKNVDEIGEKIAESIILFFKVDLNIELVNRLKEKGLQFILLEQDTNVSNKLTELIFVVSGVFSKFSRNELKKSIEENGGKNSGSLSKKTNYLIAGDKMGPAKKVKAETLGIKIITEDQYIVLIS